MKRDINFALVKPFDLQKFAEAIQGKQIVYLFRVLSKATTKAATLMAFATENERTKSKDADSTATKDGSIRTPGVSETEITATAILAKGDTLIDELDEAMENDELVECWEVNRAEKGTSDNAQKYKAKYFQGYITELTVTTSAEDMAEVSITYGANGSGEDGYATLSAEQEAVASYSFADTTQQTE